MRTTKQLVKSGLLAVLTAGTFIACQQNNKQGNNSPAAAAKDGSAASNNSFIIAYVDIDTVEAHYEYFKEKKAELEKKQQAIDNELQANVRALQNEAADFQRRANGMTQSEGEATQRALYNKQQQLEGKAQAMRSQYAEQENKFNEELQKRLNDFLTKYNSDKRYAYILSYRTGASNVLYKDEKYDITNEVIKGLNEANASTEEKK
ncbi:OmpH family outer membrane protein [Chitinophaga filiformis]|uniref:Periplasmic chaperone for outer membrane proteins Skp n=1 Tax=Chitinophaga filiformis TaxID=104663 RepID=A0A1G7WP95_CHIFI|nr:OmpH family outer membrane protein [Chitinophaga filiformis]SDG73746.1 periplasmic chaperone for outer membrane proteins Skp [Chitinophaga filiformis]